MKFSVKWNEWKPFVSLYSDFRTSADTVYDDVMLTHPQQAFYWARDSALWERPRGYLSHSVIWSEGGQQTTWTVYQMSRGRNAHLSVVATFIVTKLEE